MEGIIITTVEQQSLIWQKIEKHLKERLQGLREQNDNDMPESYTIKIRGQIEEVKRLLELAEETPTYELPHSDGNH